MNDEEKLAKEFEERALNFIYAFCNGDGVCSCPKCGGLMNTSPELDACGVCGYTEKHNKN